MSGREPSFNADAALQASTVLITAARADLIETIETYNAEGPNLAKTALERLKQFDLSVSPARIEAADGLARELKQFADFWVPLASKAGLLLYTLMSDLYSLAVEMMPIQFPTHEDNEGRTTIEIALAHGRVVDEALQRNEIVMAGAAVAEKEIAEALQEIAGVLTARLNLLAAFIHRIDPAPGNTDALPSRLRTISKTVINETALMSAEEFLRAAAKEALARVPVAGIAVSVVKVVQEVREKREALRKQRELLEKLAASYAKPGLTDDMSIQLQHFQQDDESIKELLALIGDVTRRMTSSE